MWNPFKYFAHKKKNKDGLVNFGVVVPHVLYRSAKPDAEALEALKNRWWINTVLDLRQLDAAEREERREMVESAGMKYMNIPMDDHGHTSDSVVDSALEVIAYKGNQPVLVHCEGGRHRTGLIVAAFRVLVQGWTVEAAYKEAVEKYNFYSAWGHSEVKKDLLALGE